MCTSKTIPRADIKQRVLDDIRAFGAEGLPDYADIFSDALGEVPYMRDFVEEAMDRVLGTHIYADPGEEIFLPETADLTAEAATQAAEEYERIFADFCPRRAERVILPQTQRVIELVDAWYDSVGRGHREGPAEGVEAWDRKPDADPSDIYARGDFATPGVLLPAGSFARVG